MIFLTEQRTMLRYFTCCKAGEPMTRRFITAQIVVFLCAAPLFAQSNRQPTYTLKPTPKTVAWGYYDAKAAAQETPANKAGEALYKQRCAACHEGAVPRAPNRAALKQMSPENIRFALKAGSMVVQGLGLSSSQIADVIEFLTGKQPAKEQMPAEAFCAAGGPVFADPLAKPHWNG